MLVLIPLSMSIQHITVKQLYFYIVSFIALLVVLFNLQSFLMISARYIVFKTAPSYSYQPPFFPFPSFPPIRKYISADTPGGIEDYQTQQENQMTTLLDALKNNQTLTAEQQSMIDDWLRSYQQWKFDQDDQVKQVMDSLLMNATALVIFIPVFWYHFRNARKQTE